MATRHTARQGPTDFNNANAECRVGVPLRRRPRIVVHWNTIITGRGGTGGWTDRITSVRVRAVPRETRAFRVVHEVSHHRNQNRSVWCSMSSSARPGVSGAKQGARRTGCKARYTEPKGMHGAGSQARRAGVKRSKCM
eukprot:364930-Chlamydomonas_euryale.AAC.21